MQNQILTNNLFLYNVCSAYNPVINLRIDFTSICIIKEILNNFIYIYIHIAKIDCRTYVN